VPSSRPQRLPQRRTRAALSGYLLQEGNHTAQDALARRLLSRARPDAPGRLGREGVAWLRSAWEGGHAPAGRMYAQARPRAPLRPPAPAISRRDATQFDLSLVRALRML